mgnify:CR=1 FL=1
MQNLTSRDRRESGRTGFVRTSGTISPVEAQTQLIEDESDSGTDVLPILGNCPEIKSSNEPLISVADNLSSAQQAENLFSAPDGTIW